jgi:hypothetical protein
MFVNNNVSSTRLFFCAVTLSALSTQVFADALAPPASPSPASYGMTSGRLVATSAAVAALIGVIFAGLSFVRRRGGVGAILGLVLGLAGVAVGGLRVATASGIGTGGGRAGAIIALILGLIAIALCGLAIMRSRKSE